MSRNEILIVRCGYCEKRFPITEARLHWTQRLCNLRPATQR